MRYGTLVISLISHLFSNCNYWKSVYEFIVSKSRCMPKVSLNMPSGSIGLFLLLVCLYKSTILTKKSLTFVTSA